MRFKMKKLLLAGIALCTFTLTACNNEEETKDVEVVEAIDFTNAASSYKSNIMPILTSFVEDATLLQTYIQEGKVEEATKLYPLVHMYVERLKPLRSSFAEEFKKIDEPAVDGKELEAGGLHAIEYALYVKKDGSTVVSIAEKLVEDVTALTAKAATTTLDGQLILEDTEHMLKEVVEKTLTSVTKNLANAQVYDVQANLEAVQSVVEAYSNNADEKLEQALQEQLTKTLEEVAYYEVGKEDYVNFSYFTTKQMQDLINAFKATSEAFEQYVSNMK